MIAGGARTLLKLLPVLTASDETKRTQKQVQADEAALTAESKVGVRCSRRRMRSMRQRNERHCSCRFCQCMQCRSSLTHSIL